MEGGADRQTNRGRDRWKEGLTDSEWVGQTEGETYKQYRSDRKMGEETSR